MSSQSLHHAWAPIADLTDEDLAIAGSELPALMAVWAEAREQMSPSQRENFNERLHREWAIETGIIERLYAIDEGTTQLLIEHGIDASLISHDDNGRPPEIIAGMILDHQNAVEWLFDVVRQERPLTTSFIKELHALMTRKQLHAEGIDQFGRPVRIELRQGDFKQRPNNPTRPDGTLHEYCPPEHVAAEMDRLVGFHAEHMILDVPPDLAAAWLHHRFAQIHPFQDGNGRVARALASLVLIRAGWFPLVVTRNDRKSYIDALGNADTGELRPLVELVGSIQKRWVRKGLSIVGDVEREDARLDQLLDAIASTFEQHIAGSHGDIERAKQIARQLSEIAEAEFDRVRASLTSRIGAGLRMFVDCATDDDADRRHYFWHQIRKTAESLDYRANTRDYHSWVRLALNTAAGRSELLLSLHAVGREYRGVVGASMCFYRKQQSGSGDIEQQFIDLQMVSDDLFQISYSEDLEDVERRFGPWLERALVAGLDLWRRGE